MWPSGTWTEMWQDKHSRWELMKRAYTIERMRHIGRGEARHILRVPRYILAEVDRTMHRLRMMDKCRTCGLMKEFCVTALAGA